jgi:alkylation response protein AidB-like acyl-CoA dehydrogenase
MTTDRYAADTLALDRAELRELRDAIHASVAALHKSDDPRNPPPAERERRQAWRRMAEEASLLGLSQPVATGGQGTSSSFALLVAEAHGRYLVRSPHLATQALAVPMLVFNASPEQQQRMLAPLLVGETTATLAGGGNAMLTLGSYGATAGVLGEPERPMLVRGPEGPQLSGTASFVCDGSDADLVVVLATVDGSDDLTVAVVDPEAKGLGVTEQPTIDSTRSRARLDFDGTPVVELARVTVGGILRALAESSVLVAAEAVGGARACLDSTVDYVRLRHQFERPIGSFQAVQHLLADLHGELESAQACVEEAARILDRFPDARALDSRSEQDTAELAEAGSLA